MDDEQYNLWVKLRMDAASQYIATIHLLRVTTLFRDDLSACYWALRSVLQKQFKSLKWIVGQG